MAVAVTLTFLGQEALENYKKSLPLLGAASGGPHPDPSCLFHWATETGSGLTVTDVWESQEAFEAFAANKIEPVMKEVGIAQPDIKFVPVASFLTAGG
jgi:hypothetical protein